MLIKNDPDRKCVIICFAKSMSPNAQGVIEDTFKKILGDMIHIISWSELGQRLRITAKKKPGIDAYISICQFVKNWKDRLQT